MSRINDALRQATQEQKDQQVISVPRSAYRHQGLINAALFLFVAAGVAAVAYGLNRESTVRHEQGSELSRQIAALVEKHDDLMKLIQNDNGYLDTRMQLEVLDLRTDLRELIGRVDSGLETQIRLKDGMSVITKRLHNLERDHSVLAERLEAAASRQTSTPADMAAP